MPDAKSERAALEAYPFVTVHPIRYGDLDPNDHVNNAVIASYLEIGRTEFFAREGIRLMNEGRSIALVQLEITFHREILYPGFVQIASGLTKVGSSSITFDQAVFVDGERHVSGVTVTVQVDMATKRPVPWNETQRAKFAGLMMR